MRPRELINVTTAEQSRAGQREWEEGTIAHKRKREDLQEGRGKWKKGRGEKKRDEEHRKDGGDTATLMANKTVSKPERTALSTSISLYSQSSSSPTA